MRRSRTCRVERSLERHIHTFLQTRGPASVAALLPHDGDKSGYMDKVRGHGKAGAGEHGRLCAAAYLSLTPRVRTIDFHQAVCLT
jgi:hypothetical protein